MSNDSKTVEFYYAHSENEHNKWHRLKDHLESVSRLTGEYLFGWHGKAEAELAGLLHDLGKYGDKFQQRLKGVGSGLDHWSQGAYLAITKGGKAAVAGFIIQGHHIGLQRFDKKDLNRLKPDALQQNHPLGLILSEMDTELLEQRLNNDNLVIKKPKQMLFDSLGKVFQLGTVNNMLDIRRMFSALVDADFIDTEAHFNGDENGKVYRQQGVKLNENNLAGKAFDVLTKAIEEKAKQHTADELLHAIRQQLLQSCDLKAEQATGLFTLTAPTGSGKTLSMLKFALKHAQENQLERVIMVVPYLSIIEQTAKIYRDIFKDFGHDFILEHHSMSDLGKENTESDAEGNTEEQQQIKRQRLLSENWDAPIIVTTSVQFLETLFSNRPSSCRKIHRMANSIILFDEVQTLPTKLAIPSLAAVSHIASDWHSSIVFATATQPAFEHLDKEIKNHCVKGWNAQEIVTDNKVMLKNSRRVDCQFLDNLDWTTLAENLKGHHQVLCIVNLKRHALELWQQLGDLEDLFHLSTNQCVLHRQRVLEEVRQRLKNNLPCRLIATQCIEAGVDVDFPVVYRSFAPLDALIQAAGRCNREGLQESLGQFFVFEPDCEGWLYPDETYKQAALITQALYTELTDDFDLYCPKMINRYYKKLYKTAKTEVKDLHDAIAELNFPEVATKYRLIKNDSINIVVPFDKQKFTDLQQLADEKGLTSDWIKQARGLSIALYRPKQEEPVWDSLIPIQPLKQLRYKVKEDWFMVNNVEDYDEKLGYQKPNSLSLYIA